MGDATLLGRMWDGMHATFRLFAQGSPESELVELDGVTALVVPATPDRSVLNSVLYEDAGRLRRALDEVASTYEKAGVGAWTVWVHPSDPEATASLEESGHKLDATPVAMGRQLGGLSALMPHGVEWTRDGELPVLTQLNDTAYGWEETRPWTRALANLPTDGVHIYTANVDGRPACGLLTHDHDGDCDVWLVATIRTARGRGLATALLAQALVDARTRGCTTTTLQATKLGEPVYARLGYRSLGTLEMWERRRTE